MNGTEFLQYIALVALVMGSLLFLCWMFFLFLASWLDWKERRLQNKTDRKFFKMIERFRSDFDDNPQDQRKGRR